MVIANSAFMSTRDYLRAHLTPAELWHYFLEHLIQQCFENAGFAAVELKKIIPGA